MCSFVLQFAAHDPGNPGKLHRLPNDPGVAASRSLRVQTASRGSIRPLGRVGTRFCRS